MHEPDNNARAIDADLVFGVAGCGYLGNPALAIVGGPVDEPVVQTTALQNSWYRSLDKDCRAKFLISAMAELEVMLIELNEPGASLSDGRKSEETTSA